MEKSKTRANDGIEFKASENNFTEKIIEKNENLINNRKVNIIVTEDFYRA